MSAAYGVPLGGALFSLEVLRGMLALRLVLPALLASVIAAGVSWLVLPDEPTYVLPSYDASISSYIFATIVGLIAGVVSAGFVQAIAWADRHKPQGWRRLVAPVVILALLGVVSIRFPQLLGNGKDIAQLSFSNKIGPALIFALLFLKPATTVLCLGSGIPGGLFTPSLSLGALLGGAIGQGFLMLGFDPQPGLLALLGAGAVIAATTQGPISAVVLIMELTGQDRSFIAPLIVAVVAATLLARTIDPRSIYDARLTDEELRARQKLREPPRL
jgi:CIC family chloride channel protein